MENQEPQEQESQEENRQAVPELTVTDLQNLKAIIDAASRRGAFGAGEMAAVGSVYNKLDSFLQAVAPQQQQEESSE